MAKVIKLAKLAEPCQRNWDRTYTIPQDHLEHICKVATTMPTKQNRNSYELYCITNKDMIQKVFEVAYNPDDYDYTYLKNPQTNANALLIWTFNEIKEGDHDRNVNIGISAGAASLAAVERGYKTGFCKCFLVNELKNIISNNPSHFPALILGLGKPDERFDRTDIVENDKKIGTNCSNGPKNISVHYKD
jgi:nitroreductase